MRSLIMIGLVFGCFLLACGQKRSPPVPSQELVILWAKWAPSDYLQKLSEGFTRETGVKVRIEQVSWDRYYDVFFGAMKGKSTTYDMVGGDSQWLGLSVANGYYVNLTEWFKRNDVADKMTETSVLGYAEYPRGLKRYWAVPLEGDAMGVAYRKDLFEDKKEKKDFHARFGYELAVPQTWEQLRDIASFFYRPEKGLYGVNVWASEDYDGLTMGVQTLIWSYGASLGNDTSFKVKGFLNTPAAAKALKLYKEMHRCGAPEWKDAYLDTNKAFFAGKAVMVMGYFAFFPDLLDPAQNPYAKATGFFANPAGPSGRFTSLGGQGLSIIRFSKQKELSLKFVEWFIREDVQHEWARLGGYSCSKAVIHSEEFLNATPYNRALTESLGFMKDFWAVPEYIELLGVSQKHFHDFLFKDDVPAERSLENVANEWENIFESAGYYKE